VPKVQRIQHASIPMPPEGHAAARAFYTGALGMDELPVPQSLIDAGVDVVWFRAGEDGHELHVYVERTGAPRAPGQHLCLQVDDLSSLLGQLAEHGVAARETTPIPGRPRRVIVDPFGNQIEITEIG
jgi:catechol 2,3-dioxygenase-like lactoylglutathione lyase family enzyme